MTTPRRMLLSLLALTAVACGPKYGQRVPDKLVEKLPFEVRIELLEAENDLAVAIDRRDDSDSDVLRTRDALRRAKSRLDAAEDEVDKADDAVSKEVAKLAVAEAEARLEYLDKLQDENLERTEVAELELRCAMAQFELARLNAARKAKVEGAQGLDKEDFEGQLKECRQDVDKMRADMKKVSEELSKARASWDEKKQALAAKTFDARASPYVE